MKREECMSNLVAVGVASRDHHVDAAVGRDGARRPQGGRLRGSDRSCVQQSQCNGDSAWSPMRHVLP